MYANVENVIGVSVSSEPKVNFSRVSRPYQLKLIKQLKPRAGYTLWFMKSCGQEIGSIKIRDGDGLRQNVNYSNSDQISTDEKEIDGAEVVVEQELKCAIHSIISQCPDAKQFEVKCCSDATSVARSAVMCLLSFSVTSPVATISISACHRAVAVDQGQESNILYKTSFQNVLNSINPLAPLKCIEINGEEIALNVYLGGEYEFLLMLLGMAEATSSHACIYSKHEDLYWGERVVKSMHDIYSKHEDLYWGERVIKSMHDISEHACSRSYGCRCVQPHLCRRRSSIVKR